jgi:hypothetical protein
MGIIHSIIRKDDGYRINSKSVDFTDIGIWINDDLEYGDKNNRLFIPWHNVSQVVEMKDK